ncbi:MAG: diguanylate cyclase [Desulfobacteraceae bacterium]|nr:diguanylate cyclase [Desulfobacteraceae bacterium]
MKKKLYTVVMIWMFIIGVSIYWNIISIKSNQDALVLQTAKTIFDQMVITRQWNSSHNGVYVKITDQTKPNIYLKDSQRDLECDGILLTKINPAFMTRQISELTNKKRGIQFHVAGLNPLRPENGPDVWEKNVLERFSESGSIEKGEFLSEGNDTYFRYMKGLKAEQSCLKCHLEKGYKLDDVLGGISIKIFNPPKAQIFPVILGHLIIGIVGIFIIIFSGFKLIDAYKIINHQATFDALTSIPNRRYFNDRILMEVKRSRRLDRPFSVIMADIDNFKNYNDCYGHDKGDKALISVANTIKKTLRRPSDFCARYGGEEFIIIMPETDKNGAIHLARQLIENIQNLNIKHKRSDVQNMLTLSLGVATETKLSPRYEKILKKADKALYKAKANGKNRYEFFT